MKDDRLNDREREMWVMNDEGWYRRWQRFRGSMRSFLRENRTELDQYIRGTLARPARTYLENIRLESGFKS